MDLDQVDFGYVGRQGHTIYTNCFQRYINAKNVWKRPKAECEKLLSKTETVFYFLVAEGNKRGFDVDSILEKPTRVGSTCFSIASNFSKKISEYIIGRSIKVNTIETDMMIPFFEYPDLAIPMMKKGINPLVIGPAGKRRCDMQPSSFQSEEAKELLAQFPNSIHFSIENIRCENTCAQDCPSAFKRFFVKHGKFLEMTDENRIGEGGFGSVFKGSFHGKDMAMKCVLIEQIEGQFTRTKDEIYNMNRSISELLIHRASTVRGGFGILEPEGFVIQQNQEQDENGEWIAENYNIFIYPLYDCNLYELHENNYNQFNETIKWVIMSQCLYRKCSNRQTYQEQEHGQ